MGKQNNTDGLHTFCANKLNVKMLHVKLITRV